jgi:ABC-type molybdate transport system substrate-binding protein
VRPQGHSHARVAALAGCNAAAGGQAKAPTRHTVVMVAASSLSESLTAIAKGFEASHPAPMSSSALPPARLW